MDAEVASVFMMGASAMGFGVAALFFLRFWKTTGDRLFLIFSGAFCLLGIGRIALTMVPRGIEDRHYLYLFRLVAFVLILVAIVDKNRPAKQTAVGVQKPDAA